MLIVNADDWGGWKSATDAALACASLGRITSVTAMVFMEDSERAANLARDLDLGVGLHVNLSQRFTCSTSSPALSRHHRRIVGFLRSSKYAQLLYHPFLRESFRCVFRWQLDEFQRLYGRPPTHFDGHQHMHLCANMRWDGIIPRGVKVRRSFSFWPGEKSLLNRTYRQSVDRALKRRYRVTDYFFSLERCLFLGQLPRVANLARQFNVELMTHPENAGESEFLAGDDFVSLMGSVPRASYSAL